MSKKGGERTLPLTSIHACFAPAADMGNIQKPDAKRGSFDQLAYVLNAGVSRSGEVTGRVIHSDLSMIRDERTNSLGCPRKPIRGNQRRE